ncbi:Phosphorylated carbohydrates phosphatase [Thalassocella blandensis]|nr:Phosphorylated carbohydrates phosphatase [Thalassocella blandensis]
MTYEAVIFDFNGVLLWDAPLHEKAWQVAAHKLRGSELSEDEFLYHVHGRPNAHILSYILGRQVQGEELLGLIDFKESMYRDLCIESPEVFALSPGAVSLFDQLAQHQIPFTIATASEITNLNFFIKTLGLDAWFDTDLIIYDDGVIAGKPAPDMYALAAHKLGCEAERCIVVEDAVSGFRSAQAAGIGYIIGLGPLAQHSRIQACEEVSCVIESLEQFPINLLRQKA